MDLPAEDTGFTVLEIVIALVIFAAVTVALQRARVAELSSLAAAQSELAALDVSRSLLAGAGLSYPLHPDLDQRGEDGPFQWHIMARKYVPPQAAMPLSPRLNAYWTTVTVSWTPANTSSRSIKLETLKLQSIAP